MAEFNLLGENHEITHSRAVITILFDDTKKEVYLLIEHMDKINQISRKTYSIVNKKLKMQELSISSLEAWANQKCFYYEILDISLIQAIQIEADINRENEDEESVDYESSVYWAQHHLSTRLRRAITCTGGTLLQTHSLSSSRESSPRDDDKEPATRRCCALM